jgi:TrmH family RNA methyltransferase
VIEDEAVTQHVQRWREIAGGGDAVLLDGFHTLKHALRFGAEVAMVLTSDKAATLGLAQQLADDITCRLNALAVEAPESVLRQLVPRVHPTGVVALAARPSAAANLDVLNAVPRRSPVVVLDVPRNLGNIGAVIRLAAGFDITGVITTGDADPWHSHVIRAGAGLHFATAVERLALSDLPPGPVYALDPEGEDIRSMRIPNDALLAFGSERHGISPQLRSRATRLVALPMRPQVSSFNLATSVAMALFHWMSQGTSPGEDDNEEGI